jgi:hypothetical protein
MASKKISISESSRLFMLNVIAVALVALSHLCLIDAAQSGESGVMTVEKRKHRELTEKQFHEMLSVGEWRSDPDFANELQDKAAYFGPDDQLITVGSGQKFALWINWATAFRQSMERTPKGGPYTIFALYQIEMKSFLKRLGPDAKIVVIEIDNANLVEAKYLPEEGGVEFMNAVAEIGAGLIEARPELHWQIESKQGNVISVALRSQKKTFALDVYAHDALVEHGQLSDLKKKGVGYYVKLFTSLVDYKPF